ncbi:MarR family transcriptional regulator [Massilia sp. LXY-6]|uniref:MarR family transcriptional regulator n=1 Tax=Massilia sp. LXY-6 TaxID=3379823 RepID=UPI003EE31AB7
MSTSTDKRAPAAPAKSRSATGLASGRVPSAFMPGSVEQASDLGDGYLIVKVVPPQQRRKGGADQISAVPDDQLRRLLQRLIKRPAQVGTTKEGKSRVTKRIDEDNAALLAKMDAGAMARRQELHEKGLLMTSAQLCERLGISRQAVSKAVKDYRMFWVDGPSGAQWYPDFFATGQAHRRDIERVSVVLADLPGAAKWQFFTTPKHSLDGRTPVAALEAGDVEQVVRSAAEFKERNLGR